MSSVVPVLEQSSNSEHLKNVSGLTEPVKSDLGVDESGAIAGELEV